MTNDGPEPLRPSSSATSPDAGSGFDLMPQGDVEDAIWIEVIRKMDETYVDLVRYQVQLEEKNRALEEAQHFIGSVLSSMTDVLIVCDIDGRIQQVNAALESLTGLAEAQLRGQFTHFYLSFMPDFARETYANEPWYELAAAHFRAGVGSAYRDALPARAELLHLMGLLAGKWPHSLSLRPGGSSRPVQAQARLRLLAILGGIPRFLEQQTFGDDLESIVALDSDAALRSWMDARAEDAGHFRLFLNFAEALGLDTLGRTTDSFMSYGSYPIGGERLFRYGLWDQGVRPLDIGAITEDLSNSSMIGGDKPLHPADGVTLPDGEQANGYTWCKAPRLDGQVVEVGALARQVVDGQPLIRDLVACSGGNVRNRVIARLLETARVPIAMEDWVRRLEPGEPFCLHGRMLEEGSGSGLVEAARGSLGHWVSVRKGRILNYQIVAPTTWNFSPRDREGVPGALELALEGARVHPGEQTPVAVQHIVRSFDPCMVCTFH